MLLTRSVAALLIPLSITAYAETFPSESLQNAHRDYYRATLETVCKTPVNAQQQQSSAFNRMALALAYAELADNKAKLDTSLLEQIHKLLPDFVRCNEALDAPIEPIMDSLVAFLAVNRHLSEEERRVYVQYAMKLSDIQTQEMTTSTEVN